VIRWFERFEKLVVVASAFGLGMSILLHIGSIAELLSGYVM
jgi:hypothetical protein